MSYETIASRYAQALMDIGVEDHNLPKLAAEIQSFADAYACSDELRAVLDNPLVPESGRDALLDEISRRLGLSDVIKNTIRMLAKRSRLVIVPSVARALSKMSDEKEGVMRAQVVSAKPLGEAYAKRLQSELEKMTGKRIILSRDVDETLIAGVVARVGDTVIDGSLRTRLDGLRSQLTSQ